jgi:hypothetical protein
LGRDLPAHEEAGPRSLGRRQGRARRARLLIRPFVVVVVAACVVSCDDAAPSLKAASPDVARSAPVAATAPSKIAAALVAARDGEEWSCVADVASTDPTRPIRALLVRSGDAELAKVDAAAKSGASAVASIAFRLPLDSGPVDVVATFDDGAESSTRLPPP